MTISESITVTASAFTGVEITAAQFGMNLALGYERFGSQPWEKFDEIQASVGAQTVRFPGGSESETLFDYANPNATSAVDDQGVIHQLTTADSFLGYCVANGYRATICLPVNQLLTNAAYGARDFDSAKADEVRAYVDHILATLGPAGVSTFELGNEYPTYMNAVEYGKVASALGKIVGQEIDKYYAAHPSCHDARPDVAVQVWGQATGGTNSLSDLEIRNETVMAQFDKTELAAITSVVSHYYYWEGKFAGAENVNTYDNIKGSIGCSMEMMNAWSTLTGRSLDTCFSEWNVNYRDYADTGLKQIPVMLEMFTAFVEAGVDELDFWSTMYNATAMGDYRGVLQAGGVLFQIMAQDLKGTQATEVPVTSSDYDIHAFQGHGHATVFISSMVDQALDLKMDLSSYFARFDLTSARLIAVDGAKADGAYRDVTGLAPWADPDAPILLTAQSIADYLKGYVYDAQLGAHETLVLEFNQPRVMMGSIHADHMTGKVLSDRINALAANDEVAGLTGNDTIYGGSGNDTAFGGDGNDHVLGGFGYDKLFGGFNDDTLDGDFGADRLHGGPGNDFLAGGDGPDTLWGDAGADGFVFRMGETGTDLVADFSVAEGDYLVYEGDHALTKADFQVEVRSVAGLGNATADVLVHLGKDGPVIFELQDAGNIHGLHLLDAATGAMLTLI